MRCQLVATIAIVSVTLIVATCAGAAAPASAVLAPSTKPAEPTKALAAAEAPIKAPSVAPTATPAAKIDFPAKGKSFSIIVPYPAGGVVDVAARLLASNMEPILGARVQIINKPGAGAQVGLTALALERRDGYTMGVLPLPAAVSLYLDPDRKAVFGRKDLQPVSLFNTDPMLVAVKGDAPYKTIKDLVDAAKAKPETIKISDSGILSAGHMTTLSLQRAAGVRFAIVHFDGDPAGITAVLGGHIDGVSAAPASVLSHFKSGALRILGIADKQENRFLPGAKTIQSQGYNVYVVVSRGLVVPGGTPGEIVEVLNAAVRKAVETEDFKKRAEDAGLLVTYMDTVRYASHWTEVEDATKPLIADAKAEQAQKK